MKPRLFLFGLFTVLMATFSLLAPSITSAAQTAPLTALNASPSPSPSVSASVAGPHFFTGKTVTVTGDYQGDVLAMGQQVTIEGNVDGDLLVLGGQVTVKGDVTQNLRIVGGIVELQGSVGRNVSIAAESLTMNRPAKIGGSLVAAGNSLNIYGLVAANTWLAGRSTTLAGTFNQNLEVTSQQLQLLNGVVIGGNLNARVAKPIAKSGTVAIKGQQQISDISTASAQMNQSQTSKLSGGALSWLVLSILMGLLGGAILLALFPAVGLRLADQTQTALVASLGWGFVWLILAPIIAILLMITVIGLPLGIMLLVVYVVALMLSNWVAAYALGSKIYHPGPLPTYTQQLTQFVIGLVILQVVELIPVIGWIIRLGAMLVGLGALVLVFKNVMNNNSESETIPPVAIPAMTAPVRGRQSRKRKARSTKK